MQETFYYLNTPVSIALLSDLHNRDYHPAIKSIQAHPIDFIAIAGDIIMGRRPKENKPLLLLQENVLPFLNACVALAPTFLSLGNHEHLLCEKDIDLILSTGVTLLDNEWIHFRDVYIGGLTPVSVLEFRQYRRSTIASHSNKQVTNQLYPYRSRIERKKAVRHNYKEGPDLSWLDTFEKQAGFKILLSHHPEYWQYLAPHNIDLILSGHAHGGQWRIGNQGIYSSGQGLFPKLTSGVTDGRLVISRGLANTAPVPRFHNPTEITYII